MDSTAHLLHAAHDVYARSGGIGGDAAGRPGSYKIVGIVLAITSGLFIGVSFVIKKHGLLQANSKYQEEAGEGYGYLKNAWWWAGMSLMIVGEICNFVAYAFTDAILVTPMGALTVVVCAILSAIFLKERLSFVGKVGCFNCIVGSIIIAVSAPSQSSVASIQEMQKYVIAPGFLSYAGVIIITCAVMAFYFGPKYGKKSMMVYISICSLIGGLSVVATQGLGAAIVSQISGSHGGQFKQWFLYVLLVFVKALNLFNAALVTPTYYVFFTSSTMVTSAVLFQGFKGTAIQILQVIMGFLQICSGVVLLQLSQSAKDVPDAAVFKGDLDQVRTVAEMEESEFAPRADTIRGGAAILRTLSKARSIKEFNEARKIKEEHMAPIGEGEAVEFDGLRRRRTVLDPSRPPTRSATVVRTKTLHPPLGMTHFPDEESEDDDSSSFHPGFFQRLRSRGKSTSSRGSARATSSSGVGMSNLSAIPSLSVDGASDEYDPYKYAMSQDTSYKATVTAADSPHKPGSDSPAHIQFANLPDPHSIEDDEEILQPPKLPQHIAKRQFSFTNVFSRNRSESAGESSKRPVSRHSRRESREGKAVATEEERLGLVKGDSSHLLPIQSVGSLERIQPGYQNVEIEDEWRMEESPDRGEERGFGGGRGGEKGRGPYL
ncbi:DUF803-domain-containing protein [Dothidotthia symphoricarpi CBS 119687]|uniref:DUF803-domain-containing protein n=1 Tax=Dothidotthia symphoricarpi CBS 119687 TaxID=1392245 RepID=A0A6A5ZYZ3_9PLEO|nr:DUF803-domain-containing protein [Dothidotthia symphoricarpi CBS 119687]KAF2124114.1 DUF803-domain-containing protein [Dothidotthia symphoricarpi CBS 119687]